MYREVARSAKGRQTEPRAVSDGWAVSDTIGWQYDKVPADIAETITQLCGEVPSLGEASSFTALYTGDVEPTHTIDTKSGPFEAGGMPVRVPGPGRINALMRAHAEAYPAKVPHQGRRQDQPRRHLAPFPGAHRGPRIHQVPACGG